MRALTPLEIVCVWEAGLSMHPIDRALAMLRPVSPELDGEALAALPIGARDARLLALRERMFGAEVQALARCPSCATEVELATSTTALRVGGAPAAGPITLEHEGKTLELKLPDSRDLAAAAQASDVAAAAELLLARCVVRGEIAGERARDAVAQALSAADPQAELYVELACPDCGHAWQVTLDVADFLWSELAAEARRLLHQVHVLASAYGWSEEAVLQLGPARRHFYLQMAGA